MVDLHALIAFAQQLIDAGLAPHVREVTQWSDPHTGHEYCGVQADLVRDRAYNAIACYVRTGPPMPSVYVTGAYGTIARTRHDDWGSAVADVRERLGIPAPAPRCKWCPATVAQHDDVCERCRVELRAMSAMEGGK